MLNTIATIHWVKDETVDEGPCPQCSDEDAFITMNVYVRAMGEYTRFVECCIKCGKRVALEERPAEVLIEIPESLRGGVEAALA
jgi:hypothetical protein